MEELGRMMHLVYGARREHLLVLGVVMTALKVPRLQLWWKRAFHRRHVKRVRVIRSCISRMLAMRLAQVLELGVERAARVSEGTSLM